MLNHRYVHSKPLAHSVLHKLDTCSTGILVFEKSVTRNLREANQNSNSNISIKTKTKLEHIKKIFWYYGVPYIIHLGLLCYKKLNHNRYSIRSVLLLWFAYLYGFFFFNNYFIGRLVYVYMFITKRPSSSKAWTSP